MHLTPKELQNVAASRYWTAKTKAILIGFLAIINIIGLCFLGLFLRGDLPTRAAPLEYSLNETIVSIQGNLVFLNGETMTLASNSPSSSISLPLLIILAVILALGYWFYHYTKARQYGRDLLEESINKEKQ
jgi:hypothetical protein